MRSRTHKSSVIVAMAVALGLAPRDESVLAAVDAAAARRASQRSSRRSAVYIKRGHIGPRGTKGNKLSRSMLALHEGRR